MRWQDLFCMLLGAGSFSLLFAALEEWHMVVIAPGLWIAFVVDAVMRCPVIEERKPMPTPPPKLPGYCFYGQVSVITWVLSICVGLAAFAAWAMMMENRQPVNTLIAWLVVLCLLVARSTSRIVDELQSMRRDRLGMHREPHAEEIKPRTQKG